MADSRRNSIEEIRQKLNILDVVSEYVTVKRAGKNLKGLCPFHSEKTPSFTVNEDYQSWHCFGCGEHGDVFSFVMKIENLTFAEALERLAKRAGVELKPAGGFQINRRELLAKVNSVSAAYYSSILKKSLYAQQYLQSRGVTQDTITLFGIGYSLPDWDTLCKHLESKRISLKDAAEVGLVVLNNRNNTMYDRFRNRIVFPIHDIQSRVIGFGGRAVGDDIPKYLNSPETPLFNKSRMLYGLNFARKSITELGYVIVVEGYMDVVTAHQAGFVNSVATMGTALTTDHIKLLSRYTNKVVLSYDSDSAGMKAALKSATMFIEADIDVRIVRLPKGADPDSMIREGRTAEYSSIVSNALPLIDYKLALLTEKYDANIPSGRTAILKEAARIIADVDLFVERERYIKDLITYHPNLDIGNTKAQNQIRADVESIIKRKNRPAAVNIKQKAVSSVPSAVIIAENMILKALLKGHDKSELVIESLTPDHFKRDASRNAAKLIFEKYTKALPIIPASLIDEADDAAGKYISELIMSDNEPPVTDKALQDCIKRILKSKKSYKTSDILAPYIKQGNIKTDNNKEQTMQELETYLRESGKLPNTKGSKGV